MPLLSQMLNVSVKCVVSCNVKCFIVFVIPNFVVDRIVNNIVEVYSSSGLAIALYVASLLVFAQLGDERILCLMVTFVTNLMMVIGILVCMHLIMSICIFTVSNVLFCDVLVEACCKGVV